MEPERKRPHEKSGAQGDWANADLFRQEAIAHHLGDAGEGNLLRVAPSWASWTYWLLVGIAVAGILYLSLGSAPIYESGPAVLRVSGAEALMSPMEGPIERVEVLPGQQVEAGQVLVRLRADSEMAQLERYQSEFDLQLLARLRDPSDTSAERELRRLRPELERAKATVERTLIRAPHGGAVQDVRIKSGDFLSLGDHVLSIVPVQPEYTVIAFLPGHVLPQLTERMPVRLRMTGYAYAYVSSAIESVGRQVIGPTEARRYLGSEIGDTVQLSGPVVVVRCRLEGDRFYAWRQQYRVYDGMRAEAEVEVRRERLLFRLIPGLRAFAGTGKPR